MARPKETKRKKEQKKKTRQGCGRHTKFGKAKKSIKRYRGQGGKRKSVKNN